MVQDIRNLDDVNAMIPFMPDEEILGSFQIEKYMLEGIFIGAKQYRVWAIENHKLGKMVKVKGASIPSIKKCRNEKDEYLKQYYINKRDDAYEKIGKLWE